VVFLPLTDTVAVALMAAGLGFLGAWSAVSRELRHFSRPA